MAREMIDIGLVPVLDASDNVIGEDLGIQGGDIVMVESTYQHQRQLMLNNKGDFKQNPTICVGVPTYEDDEGSNDVIRAIAQEFMNDGMEVDNLEPNTDSVADSTAKIFENAYYK